MFDDMEPRLQRRIQRYGWDLAAADYEPLWRAQIARAHTQVMECAALMPGERVLDVACGTGLITFAAAQEVGPQGEVVGIDISEQMTVAARQRAQERNVANASFIRMDAERLDQPDASFDVVICSLGLMYVPDPDQAIREMRRVLRPGGRLVIAVWGERSRCGWSPVFPIVDAEVNSEVCPLFFSLGQEGALARLCADARLEPMEQHRVASALIYESGEQACNAAFVGGPVALAWSRFDTDVRTRVRRHYLDAIEPWREGQGYRVPGEFVVVAATRENQ